jgi:excisionase family DNA binding protein
MSEAITPILLRIGEVCSMLGMSKSTIYREIQSGNLRALKIGKSIRVSQEEVNRYVESIPALVTTNK